MKCSGRRARRTKTRDRNDPMAVASHDSVSWKYAEIRDGSGMREFTENNVLCRRYRRTTGPPARTRNEDTRLSFFGMTANMLFTRKRLMNKEMAAFLQLTVSELLPAFVHCCLSRALVGIG